MIDPSRQFPGSTEGAITDWLDALVRHQIGVLRVGGSAARQVTALLDATERDLRRALNDLPPNIGTPARVRRMNRVISEIREIRHAGFLEASAKLREEFLSVALAEPGFMSQIAQTVFPVSLEAKLPPARLLRSIATSRPFEGKTLSQWARHIERTDIDRITSAIRIGYTQGETPPQIARRIVGTVQNRGRDGVTQITRRGANAITRTAINHAANQARREWAEENRDVFGEELYQATLDSATTPICRSLDGKKFPVGKGPIPPLHVGCRSLRSPLPDGEALGNRPTKPVTERGLVCEYREANNIPGRGLRRSTLPRGTRGDFDKFARRRTRELIGRTPAKTSYQTFLTRQPAQFQDDLLGPTRGALFRRGGITLEQFVDPKTGRNFPLSSLAKMHRSAFEAAGFNPADFAAAA